MVPPTISATPARSPMSCRKAWARAWRRTVRATSMPISANSANSRMRHATNAASASATASAPVAGVSNSALARAAVMEHIMNIFGGDVKVKVREQRTRESGQGRACGLSTRFKVLIFRVYSMEPTKVALTPNKSTLAPFPFRFLLVSLQGFTPAGRRGTIDRHSYSASSPTLSATASASFLKS
jgi:hypothetical protein